MIQTGKRLAFSMLEILVAVAVVTIIAATVISTLNFEKADDSARIAAVAKILDDLMQSIAGQEITLPATSFRQAVGVYPGNLVNLTDPLTALNAAISKNSCGQPYTATNVTNAAAKSPYYPISFLVAGTKFADGFVANDAIVRADPAATTRSTIAIQFPGVSLSDAQALDTYMDGPLSGTAGAIRYTVNGTNPVTVSFLMATRGC